MFRKLTAVIFSSVFLIGAWNFPALAKSKNARKNTPVYYLSIGTSLAAGVQADPLTGESIISDVSYPSELAGILRREMDLAKIRHVNLGCPGETAGTLIYGGRCDYPQGSQLDQAVRFLHAHGKFTGLITIDIGANDVLQCVDGAVVDPVCLQDTLDQLLLDLAHIIETLRDAAPGVPIVGMNYYNPLLAAFFVDPEFAESTIGFQLAVNLTLEAVYAAYGIPVADVAGAFMSYDLDTDLSGPGGSPNGIPDSVDLVCAWTWMCAFQNIHANDIGYAVIAEEFQEVLPDIPMRTPPRKRFRKQCRR